MLSAIDVQVNFGISSSHRAFMRDEIWLFLASCFTLTRFGDGGMVVDGRNSRTSGAGFFILPSFLLGDQVEN